MPRIRLRPNSFIGSKLLGHNRITGYGPQRSGSRCALRVSAVISHLQHDVQRALPVPQHEYDFDIPHPFAQCLSQGVARTGEVAGSLKLTGPSTIPAIEHTANFLFEETSHIGMLALWSGV